MSEHRTQAGAPTRRGFLGAGVVAGAPNPLAMKPHVVLVLGEASLRKTPVLCKGWEQVAVGVEYGAHEVSLR